MIGASFLNKSIDLSATNWTFVTKGEIENKCLTTHTEDPKLNNWDNTTMNQLGIQYEPSRRCIQEVSLNFTFLLILKIVT